MFKKIIFIIGGLENGVLNGCLIAEEYAYGCSGIGTALGTTNLGVSFITQKNTLFFSVL